MNLDAEKVSVYTDGACSGNGKQHATGGIGIFWGRYDHPL
jgi:ribonuclease HI